MYSDNESKDISPDQLTLVISILFVAYGILGTVILAFTYYSVPYWLFSSLFIILGLAFYFFPTDIAKTILGIIGMIGSFYAAISWADSAQNGLWGGMTLFSLTLLALCFGAVCHVTCTWPNLNYD